MSGGFLVSALFQAFPTLLENGSSVYAFAISKDTKTAKEFPPILYINNGQGLSWTPVGKNVLVPLGSLIAPPPPGVNGSIWDVLTSRPELSKTVELLSKLPDLQAALSSLPDMKKRTGYYTLLAPGKQDARLLYPGPAVLLACWMQSGLQGAAWVPP